MKNVSILTLPVVLLLLLTRMAVAQQFSPGGEASNIHSTPLILSEHKTTHLVFPAAIKSVDRGSGDILAEPATPAEHVLRVKAGKKQFKETNLTVITADGGLYPFLVNYAADPPVLTIRLARRSWDLSERIRLWGPGVPAAALERVAFQVSEQRAAHSQARAKQHGVELRLAGVFVVDDVMFYRLELHNNSMISYEAGQLRFFVRDKKQSKRTASQELEQTPLHVLGNADYIPAETAQVLVYALPKMTFPSDRFLLIQLQEKQGGRHLHLKLNSRALFRAIQADKTIGHRF